MNQIVLYNTRTRRKEPFESIEAGHVRIYSCGPTVYASQHLGNLRPYVVADLLRRALEWAGYRVTQVINVTDVGHLTDDADAGEDKMERAAAKTGRTAAEIAAEYTEKWLSDRRRLNCRDPEVLCKATEHIGEQIELARKLEAKGYTYRIADGIYFDVSKFPRYAEFACLDLAGQEEGARVEVVEGKRNPSDFAIWKFAQPGVKRQQEWDSPWGVGFPGWHLECSAMSSKYLGDHFDIHTGGVDHVRVHHTNEIAQSECASGRHPWVNWWMHNEFLDFKGQKMSKSKGEVALLQDLVDDGIEPLAYRYFLLQAHYRQQQTFTAEGIGAAARGYRKLLRLAAEVRDCVEKGKGEGKGKGNPEAQAPYRECFAASVCDDLNAPQALAAAWEVARNPELAPADRRDLLLDFDCILGLDLATGVAADQWKRGLSAYIRGVPANQQSQDLPTRIRCVCEEETFEPDSRIDALLAEREEARGRKDWATADRIRDELAKEGVEVFDTPQGPCWRRK